MFRSFKIMIAAVVLLSLQLMPVHGQEIRIGMSLPFSSPAEKLARQYEFGARLALEMYNANSTEKARLFISDDGCDEKIAALAADELRAKKPQIITGLLCNVTAYHFAEAFKADGIAVLVAGAQSERLIKDREKNDWTLFRLSPGDDEPAHQAVDYFSRAWNEKPYAIVDDGTVYGRNLADAFRAGMEEKGLPPQFQDNFRPTQSTQARLVRRLRRAGTSHVFVGASAEDVAMIGLNSEEMEIPLEIGSGEALSVFPFIAPETLPAGSITAILKLAEVRPKLPELLIVRLSEEGLEPEPYVLLGYQAVQVALKAAKPTFDLTMETLRTATFDTILGPARFDENGDNTQIQYRAFRWQDGAFRELQTEGENQ